MKDELRSFRIGIWAFALIFWGTVIYVAYHFIHKWW